MAQIINSPQALNDIQYHTVFLAGTIEDGRSVDWQAALVDELADVEITILNPRRAEWDASWVQSIDQPHFRAQVEWELMALERADLVFLYFAAGSYSPISLLELGLHAQSGKVIIVCPEGFWKKGNVDIVAHRFGLPVFTDSDAGIRCLKQKIRGLRHLA